MLTRVVDGVRIHVSGFLQSNAVVVDGPSGVLVIDPGITRAEIACLAHDLAEGRQTVVAGFSTHPHFDHVLWQPALGDAPRYATARCAADIADLLADAAWNDRVAEVLPEDIADEIPMELFGLLTGLAVGADEIPWDGPRVRIIEHQAHAPGHASLLVEDRGVLVAGDMLSDTLIPFLELDAADPVADYLAGLDLLEGVAEQVDAVIPGHGSVGGRDEMLRRIAMDRAYVEGLRDGLDPADPRLQPSAVHGAWLPGVDEWQRKRLRERNAGDVTSA